MTITIRHDGDTWRILAEGATRDGKTFCHLASTTRGRQQRNGWNPVQMCDWIETSAIRGERDPITSYYEDRANSGQSRLEAKP